MQIKCGQKKSFHLVLNFNCDGRLSVSFKTRMEIFRMKKDQNIYLRVTSTTKVCSEHLKDQNFQLGIRSWRLKDSACLLLF